MYLMDIVKGIAMVQPCNRWLGGVQGDHKNQVWVLWNDLCACFVCDFVSVKKVWICAWVILLVA